MPTSAPWPPLMGRHRRKRTPWTISAIHHLYPVVNETSAGGVILSVKDGQAYVAVTVRCNRGGRLEWCLPKSHLEGIETPEEVAVWEVSEKIGIFERVLTHLVSIDYWFSSADRRIHKMAHHPLLEVLPGLLITEDDPDQGVERAEQARIDKVGSRLAYPNKRRIVAATRAILSERDRREGHEREGGRRRLESCGQSESCG